MNNPQVIVIGAGIAGLTAAWNLKKAGISALVLESEQHIGGRMRSVQVEDALIDCAAQFLSNAYSIIPKLIADVGLSENFVITNETVGIVRQGDIVLINPHKPWQLVSNHLLSIYNFFRLAFQQFRLFTRTKTQISKLLHYLLHLIAAV